MSDQMTDHRTEEKEERIGGMTCHEFQAQLPELLAAGALEFSAQPHLKGCENCAALVRDLQYIADAARQLMPAHDPSPDLWSQIQSSMDKETSLAPPASKNAR